MNSLKEKSNVAMISGAKQPVVTPVRHSTTINHIDCPAVKGANASLSCLLYRQIADCLQGIKTPHTPTVTLG